MDNIKVKVLGVKSCSVSCLFAFGTLCFLPLSLSMAFLFLCFDRVSYIDDHGEILLERNTLDETLAKILIERTRDQGVSKLLIITGPWWFTNLRVGTLVVNLLLQYIPSVSCVVVSKIDLYQYLVVQWFLPPHGVLYIWQQKSVWHYDFVQKTHTTQGKDIPIDSSLYFVDPIDTYFPVVYDDNRVSFVQESNTIIASYRWKTLSLAPLIQSLLPVSVVLPSYYVQPIIW